ncbi:hypothetical protein ACTG9Q_07695 [Actinokineospora sp. 24-640]
MNEQSGVADPTDPALRLGIVPLRPLTVPDLLRGAIDAVRRNPAALLGVGLVVAVLSELAVWAVLVLTLGEVPGPADLGGELDLTPLLAAMIRIVVVSVVAVVLEAVVNTVVPRAVFGHSMGAVAALRAGSPRLPALLGVLALTGVLIGGVAAVAALVMLASPLFGPLLVLPLFVLILYLAVALLFAPSLVVVENLSPPAALVRSRALVHGPPAGWWRVLGVVLIAALAGSLLSVLVETIGGGGMFASALAAIVVGTVVTPPTLALHALLYVDHRCRTEGIEGLWRTAG